MKNYGQAVRRPVIQPLRIPYFLERERAAILGADKRYSQAEVFARLGIILSVMTLAVVALSLWLYGFKVSTQINVLEKELTTLHRANDLEMIQASRLENLDRLYQVATAKLGLVKPARIEYIFVD